MKFDEWNSAFNYLGRETQKGRCVIIFDEISWVGSEDPDFLGKLKNAWDLIFKKNDELILFLCGSASSWIEENILMSRGFYGRVSYTLTLKELPLNDCNEFWVNQENNISPYEKLKILAVTGGVPRYLEEVDPKKSSEENIKSLCFMPGGLLVEDFNKIFNVFFLSNSPLYKEIVSVLVEGSKENKEICDLLDISQTGRISQYLNELKLAGFISREASWDIKGAIDKVRLYKYRLSDNYLRFYFKYIEKNLNRIEQDSFHYKSLNTLPEWSVIMGLQFENLVLNNREFIWKKLDLLPDDIVVDNPYFQRKTTQQLGCQIDYMIQTRFNCLYICEIKFSQTEIGKNVIKEVQNKIDNINSPKGYSFRPVLIHVNGVSEAVIESNYFSDVIDFSDIFKE